jgi:arylsulfatase A-like enzyme
LKKYEDRLKSVADPRRRTYSVMLSALDDNVGLLLKALDRNKHEQYAAVFLSDNGGPTQGNTSRNDPVRGVKAQVYEGGFSIPFMMQWPGHVPKGKVYSDPVIALDLLPTFTAVAGGRPDASRKVDGVNLLPFVEGRTKAAARAPVLALRTAVGHARRRLEARLYGRARGAL